MSAIDLMHSGVHPDLLNPKTVHNALVRTAASYINRGLRYLDWRADLDRPGMTLGQQARYKAGAKVRTTTAHEKALRGAWEAAETWCAARPVSWTREAASAHARAVRAFIVADPDQVLTDNERAVLGALCDLSETIGSRAVPAPRRQLQEMTDLGLTALRTAVDGLIRQGMLTLHAPGAPRGPRARSAPKANVYALPDQDALDAMLAPAPPPLSVPGTPASGAPLQGASGAPLSEVLGAPHTRLVVPPLSSSPEPALEPPVNTPVSLTFSGSPQAVAQLLALVQGISDLQVDATVQSAPPLPQGGSGDGLAEVIPLPLAN